MQFSISHLLPLPRLAAPWLQRSRPLAPRHSLAKPDCSRLLTVLYLHFFLPLTQLHGSAELRPGLFHFSHFSLYLVHGSVSFCIFFPTASQPHAFFMSLCASGLSCRKPCSSPNALEFSCVQCLSAAVPESVFFPS